MCYRSGGTATAPRPISVRRTFLSAAPERGEAREDPTRHMNRRDLALVTLAFLGVLTLALMLFVTVLGVVGRGVFGGLMTRADGAMFGLMVSFPVLAVGLMGALAWWIYRRQGW